MSMNILAMVSLFIWPPIVLGIFATRGSRRAVITSFVVAWLFLPSISWNLPGLPNYTKMTATVLGVLLATLIFDANRLLSLRPRWFDLPVASWCLCPFAASISNNNGVYEGLSAILDEMLAWGLPYLIGRAYFRDLPGLRELAIGIAIGGLSYIPLCLLEIRMSSAVCSIWVYGISHWEALRFGTYRPRVFLQSGLECGMWMACTSLVCWSLWATGAVKTLRGYSFGKLTLALIVTCVLCRSTGAILLMICGIGAIWIARHVAKPWPIILLMSIAPLYCGLRTTGLWSGRAAVDISKMTLGADRAQSFEFRLNNEDILIGRALERPTFGWGRFGGSRVLDRKGKATTIVDGYWIIALGVTGTAGLASLIAMLTLPMILTIRRFPAQTWSGPEVGPAVALAVMLTLVMADFVSNAMPNPAYALIMGALSGLPAGRPAGRRSEAESCLEMAAELAAGGQSAHAEGGFRRAIELASLELADDAPADPETRRVLAEALDGLGHSRMAVGRPDEAEAAFREAVALREEMAAESPELDRYRDLAIAREGLGRTLAEAGRPAEGIEERRKALDVWNLLIADLPGEAEYRSRRVDALNDLAWTLSTEADPKLRDPSWAVRLAEEAVRESADRPDCWNTLGVARCRAGDWPGAVEALEHSASTGPAGGTAFDYYFLAMACIGLGDPDRAREWYEKGVAWSERHRPGHPTLARFRSETRALLEEAEKPPAGIP